MVPIVSLWLPIVLSAMAVFFVSYLVHMVFRYHWSDFKRLPAEGEVMEALRKHNIPPGDYAVPFAGSPEALKSPEFLDKRTKGPVAFMTFVRTGPVNMGPSLLLWFLYSLVVGVIAAYVTGRAVGPGEAYLRVFRFAGCTAFVGYSLALLQDSIWYKRNWGATLKTMFDGLIYALLTAGFFGWLWPR